MVMRAIVENLKVWGEASCEERLRRKAGLRFMRRLFVDRVA
jgi:hypothetical protein